MAKGAGDCRTIFFLFIIYIVVPLYRRKFCDGHIILVEHAIVFVRLTLNAHKDQDSSRIESAPLSSAECVNHSAKKTHLYSKQWEIYRTDNLTLLLQIRKSWINCKSPTNDCISTTCVQWNVERLFNSNTVCLFFF